MAWWIPFAPRWSDVAEQSVYFQDAVREPVSEEHIRSYHEGADAVVRHFHERGGVDNSSLAYLCRYAVEPGPR